jgi:hypothetical protein
MNRDETRAFAQNLMKEVWEPFNSSAMPRFYHPNVVGHHRRADGSTQELSYADVAGRLDWDKQTSADAVTGGKVDVEVWYLYHLADGKVKEFWTVASVDFDYKARDTKGMPTR